MKEENWMNFQNVEAYLNSLTDTYGLTGLDCKVMRDHQTLFRKCVGFSDVARTKPVSDRDLYDVYSCTKIITMIAAMQCVERGLFYLDDPVEQYTPDFSDMVVVDEFDFGFPMVMPKSSDPMHPAIGKITIRRLMSMISGMSYDLESEAIRETIAKNPHADTLALASAMGRMPLLFEPGTHYFYSLGHDIVAAVVEVVTGMRYRDYLQQSIFNPLGLKDMFLHIPDSEKGRVTAKYSFDPDTQRILPHDGSNDYRLTDCYDSGGAGLCCTVDDYILILDALACGGVAHNGYQLLSQDSIDQLRSPQLNDTCREDFLLGGKIGYSYGLGVRTLVEAEKSRSPVGEFGWDGAAGAYAVIDPINHISFFYTQEVLNMLRCYQEIHPMLRDLIYEAIER